MIASDIESSEKPGASGEGAVGAQSSSNGARRDGGGEGYPREGRGGHGRGAPDHDRPRAGAMEVIVEHNIEKAMKILKRKLIKEGLFKELKSRRYYEKPSERKKRKNKESIKKMRKDEARMKKNSMLF